MKIILISGLPLRPFFHFCGLARGLPFILLNLRLSSQSADTNLILPIFYIHAEFSLSSDSLMRQSSRGGTSKMAFSIFEMAIGISKTRRRMLESRTRSSHIRRRLFHPRGRSPETPGRAFEPQCRVSHMGRRVLKSRHRIFKSRRRFSESRSRVFESRAPYRSPIPAMYSRAALSCTSSMWPRAKRLALDAKRPPTVALSTLTRPSPSA